MTVHEFDIGWATTAGERRRLQADLLACEQVRGIFLTAREDVLAVLFSGDRGGFDAWALSSERRVRLERRHRFHSDTTTTRKGAL